MDRDCAEGSELAQWLHSRGYAASGGRFSVGQLQADAHAEAEGRGGAQAVLLWEHECWRSRRWQQHWQLPEAQAPAGAGLPLLADSGALRP